MFQIGEIIVKILALFTLVTLGAIYCPTYHILLAYYRENNDRYEAPSILNLRRPQ